MNLERNHVVFVAILFSCQGTDVRERAAILPDPHVRVKRIGFSLHEADPSDADTLTTLEMLLERSAGSNCLRRLQGPGSVRPRHLVCQLLRKFRYQLTDAVDYSGPRDRRQPVRPHRYSSLARAAQPAVQIRVTACFPKIPYRSGTSRNDPAPGPIPLISAPTSLLGSARRAVAEVSLRA